MCPIPSKATAGLPFISLTQTFNVIMGDYFLRVAVRPGTSGPSLTDEEQLARVHPAQALEENDSSSSDLYKRSSELQ